MNKLLLVALLLLITKTGFSQTGKDTLVYNLPLVNGKLTYTDSVRVKGHNKAELDTAAKKWFADYFKYAIPDTLAEDKDPNSIILNKTGIDFKIANNGYTVKYSFLLIENIKINCVDGGYTYKITNIYYMPKSSFVRHFTVYQTSPEFLIGLYKDKHRSFMSSLDFGKKQIIGYLSITDNKIKACIASLNKAMTN